VDSELAVGRPSFGWRMRLCGRAQVSAPAAYDVAVTRRWWGIQVLMLVIVAVLLAGVLQRAPVVGSPVAVPVSDPPAVGGCLSEPWTGPPGFGQDGFPVATLPLGSCAAAHFGEVFSVVDIPSGVEPSGKDPCLSPTGQSAFRSYLGLPDADMAPGEDPVGGADRTGQWGSTLSAAISTIGPDAQQRSAGQRWVACVICPEWFGGRQAAYTGSVRDTASGTHQPPTPYAVCQTITGTTVFCNQPHSVEWLASADYLPAGSSVSRMKLACRTFILQRTGSPTLLDDRSLDAEVIAVAVNDGVARRIYGEVTAGGRSSAACGVTSAGRKLTDTLAGFGSGAIPWA